MQTNRKVRPTANPTLGPVVAAAVGVEEGMGGDMVDVAMWAVGVGKVTLLVILGATVMLIEGATVMFIEGATVMFMEGATVMFIEGATVMFMEGATVMFIEGATVMFIEGGTVMLAVVLATTLGDAVALLAPTVVEGTILIEEVAAEMVSAHTVSHSIRDFMIKYLQQRNEGDITLYNAYMDNLQFKIYTDLLLTQLATVEYFFKQLAS